MALFLAQLPQKIRIRAQKFRLDDGPAFIA
jgi:hypothetical protein